MKKLSFFAIAFATMLFAACGGNKTTQPAEETDTLKSFEQQQIESAIKMHLDSISSEIGKLKHPDFVQSGADGTIKLSKEEKQVKPDYLLSPAVADNASTLSEKYRTLSALGIDKRVAALYELPTEDYEKACTKLLAEINDPSFKQLDDATTLFETTSKLYEAMEANGRINYFWQMAASSLVEELYVANQNTDKFLGSLNDEAAANITFRIVLVLDALDRLTQYDPDIQPVAAAVAPLSVLNATTVDELKAQLADAKDKISAAREALLK